MLTAGDGEVSEELRGSVVLGEASVEVSQGRGWLVPMRGSAVGGEVFLGPQIISASACGGSSTLE
jgi:hypothetical protein